MRYTAPAFSRIGLLVSEPSPLLKRAVAFTLFSCHFLAPLANAQFKEVGPAPISPAAAHRQVANLLDKVDSSNRKQTLSTISGLLVWYRDLIDEEIIAAWRRDGRANLPEVIEALADPQLASAIVEYSWRQARQATFVPAYAPVLGHLMYRYPDTARPFLDDLLGPASTGRPMPDLSQTEAETVCRILIDAPDNAEWRKQAQQILPHYRVAAEAVLAEDLRGGDGEKTYRAQYWMGQLSTAAPSAFAQRRTAPAASAPTPAAPATSTHTGVMLKSLDPVTVESTGRSINSAVPTIIDFVNRSGGPVDIYWITYQGERRLDRATLPIGATWTETTFLTHPFLIVASGTGGTTAKGTGTRLAAFQAVTPKSATDPSVRDTAIITNADGTTSSAAMPTPAPAQQGKPNADGVYSVGNGATAPSIITKVDPEYSELARKLSIGGTVTLSIVVNKEGIAENIRVVKSLGMGLDQKAMEAVQKWRFHPGSNQGVPVSTRAVVEINFGLLGSRAPDRWYYSGPIEFSPDPGLTPPVLKDASMPNATGDSTNETVSLGFTVNESGSVKNIHAISGPKSGSDLLARSLEKWKFQPAAIGGQPAATNGTVRFVKGQIEAANRPPAPPPPPQSIPPRPTQNTTPGPVQPASISSVVFTGTPSSPTIHVVGRGFYPVPAITAVAQNGATGQDFGASLHIVDSKGQGMSAGYDVPAIRRDHFGLVVSEYSDTLITFALGSNYQTYADNGIYQIADGDRFTMYVRDAEFSATVHYTAESNFSAPRSSPPQAARAPVAANSGVTPSLRSVDGTLRRLVEKELLLQTASGKVLRFRLLTKTEFRDRDGKPIRDSLLHPGDRISVEVSSDDVETAVYVIPNSSGTDPEREAASAPVDAARVAAPDIGDFAVAHSDARPAAPQAPPNSTLAGAHDPILNAKDGLRYVWIPPGSFTMGCSQGDAECDQNEKPSHAERVANGFWMGRTEVTQAAYQRVTGGNPSFHKGDQLPVEMVAWTDAINYCTLIGGGLPTEMQWEYAARGGIAYARFGAVDEVAWHAGNSGRETHPVAMKLPNAFGLYDMLGNVWEWVRDGEAEMKILRGGSVIFDQRSARASSRLTVAPQDVQRGRGFRCAMEAQAPNPTTAADKTAVGAPPPGEPAPGPRADAHLTPDGSTVPVLIHKVDPYYSEQARQAKLAGIVVLSITIDTAGVPRGIFASSKVLAWVSMKRQ
jgi:TonB family protein